MKPTDASPSIWFWLVAFALLIWGVAGASIYVAYFFQTPYEFAQSAEIAAHRDAYAQYVADIPAWAIAVGIIAAVARLLGAVGLLLRRFWAQWFYTISLVFFLVALYRAFALADAGDVMSRGHIAIELVFFGLSVFSIWFSYLYKKRGILA